MRDRTVIITGGGRGIGRAVALLCAEQGGGWRCSTLMGIAQ